MKNIVFALILLCILSSPALAHHSFAMYDQTKTLTLTGKLTRFVLGANHAQLLFELLGPDGKPQLDANGKPVVWGVETGSAKQLAGAGITVETFPYGTIFTVYLWVPSDTGLMVAISGLALLADWESAAWLPSVLVQSCGLQSFRGFL